MLAGALLPQLELPGAVGRPLVDPLAPALDAMVPVFAILFCLVGRYRWLIFCAMVIGLFLAAAVAQELTAILGLNIRQIVAMYNGVLPPGIDPAALLTMLLVLEGARPATGLYLVSTGIVLMEVAPWLRRVSLPAGRSRAGTAVEARQEPAALVPPPPDLLVDELYVFADGVDRTLSFSLLDVAGRIAPHPMRMEAAGYHGDSYYLRCRDRAGRSGTGARVSLSAGWHMGHTPAVAEPGPRPRQSGGVRRPTTEA